MGLLDTIRNYLFGTQPAPAPQRKSETILESSPNNHVNTTRMGEESMTTRKVVEILYDKENKKLGNQGSIKIQEDYFNDAAVTGRQYQARINELSDKYGAFHQMHPGPRLEIEAKAKLYAMVKELHDIGTSLGDYANKSKGGTILADEKSAFDAYKSFAKKLMTDFGDLLANSVLKTWFPKILRELEASSFQEREIKLFSRCDDFCNAHKGKVLDEPAKKELLQLLEEVRSLDRQATLYDDAVTQSAGAFKLLPAEDFTITKHGDAANRLATTFSDVLRTMDNLPSFVAKSLEIIPTPKTPSGSRAAAALGLADEGEEPTPPHRPVIPN